MGSAGTTGTGGGRAGTTGSGGRAGTTGTGGTGGGGMVATFTQVYTSVLSVSCKGSGCHNPGKMATLDYSTKALAYSTLKAASGKIVAGNAMGSVLWMEVNSGAMPEGMPKISQANIDMIAAWINAGAMNN